MKQAADWTSKAIVSLDLHDGPIKTPTQATHLDGVGKQLGNHLRDIGKSSQYCDVAPNKGMYVSSASAFIVALLDIIEEQDMPDDTLLITETELCKVASSMCEEKIDTSYGFCAALWRLGVLCNLGYMKKRSRDKQPVYELLPAGKKLAIRLKERQLTPGVEASASVPLVTPAKDKPSNKALYTNDNHLDGLVLLVDTQEWGGERVGLGQLTTLLERQDVRYQTRRLVCGDYQWVWRVGGIEINLPLIIERKRADDLARSLVDGRYERQKEKMLAWKQEHDKNLGSDAHVQASLGASLKYVIEGQPEEYAVNCPDMCGAVVRCGYPTVAQLHDLIDDLEDDSRFDVIHTSNIPGTVQLLATIHNELQIRLANGDFNSLLSNKLDHREQVSASKVVKRRRSATVTLSNSKGGQNTVEYKEELEITHMQKKTNWTMMPSSSWSQYASNVATGSYSSGKKSIPTPNNAKECSIELQHKNDMAKFSVTEREEKALPLRKMNILEENSPIVNKSTLGLSTSQSLSGTKRAMSSISSSPRIENNVKVSHNTMSKNEIPPSGKPKKKKRKSYSQHLPSFSCDIEEENSNRRQPYCATENTSASKAQFSLIISSDSENENSMIEKPDVKKDKFGKQMPLEKKSKQSKSSQDLLANELHMSSHIQIKSSANDLLPDENYSLMALGGIVCQTEPESHECVRFQKDIAQIQEIFPDKDASDIAQLLLASNGNIEMVVSTFL